MTTIHASLHVRNISKLHGSAKSVALGALNGSATDLARLCTPQFLKDLPDAEIQGILPVLYTHLDPALVPSLDMLENIITRSIHLPCLDNTVRALYALGEISERRESFPLDAARDIWRRVWKWIDFIHTYWDFLPGFPPEQGVTQIGNSMLLLQLMNHPPTQRAMFMTPGVRRMIAAAWRSMLNYHATRHTRASLPELAHLLLSLADGLKETKNFEEILDAFGGSHRNMADAFKYQLSLATAEAKSLGAIAVLHGVLVFLESTYHPYKEFTSTLLSCGIVPSLVAALDIDGHMPVSAGVPYTVDGFLGTVVKYIQTSPGYPWITQALKAGLLRYIILFSENEVKPSNDGKYPDLKALLTEFLPNGMVSYHVVTQMKKSLAEVSTLSRRDKFSRSALFEDWKVFEALVRDRVIVLDQWERVGRPSFVACDNMKCNQIDKKGKFRCCAGCRSANYCSAECQRSDWKAAHRTSCTSLYAERRCRTISLGYFAEILIEIQTTRKLVSLRANGHLCERSCMRTIYTRGSISH
ncbi:hypothetical protein B0H16DRAFT_1541944 [Mycena metata]|uniref:MYND-type domain-containing protein n=1 Tax=Mycena metata TaxID=1033252 RepID=A0AAD7J2S3_9AGAR|nr:hypothetical protein B0H16DRAFT_1541944 [Mycena metata]